MSTREVVRLAGCAYRYPTFTLGPVDLSFADGHVHALLGPNGSGKTTLINLMMGLAIPATGEVHVLGERPKADGAALYRDVGFSPDDDDLVDELSASEYWHVLVTVLARQGADVLDCLTEADELAERLSFAPPARQIAGYSHGMRRKTQLIAALLHRPRLIVLDEPTNGLDPISAYALGEILRERATDGACVVVATHDLAWAERFSDLVAIISAGRVSSPDATASVLRPDAATTLLDGFVAATESLRRESRGG